MESALTIAKWFLGENRERIATEDAEYITNLKLQKLLYYAQGAHLALFDEPLFREPIEAWPHGPVVSKVYHRYKSFKAQGINEPQEGYHTDLDSRAEAVLKEVFDRYGIYSASGLRNLTHNEAPWKNTKPNEVIGLDLIKDYFKNELFADIITGKVFESIPIDYGRKSADGYFIFQND